MYKLKNIFLLFCVIIPLTTYSQIDPGEAKEHFSRSNYAFAITVYEKLIKQEPDNPDYLHHIGICYLNTNVDKTLAIPYLEKAVQHPKVDNKAFFNLGLAYQHAYKFDEAFKVYNKYKTLVKDKELEKVNRQIETCYNAKELIKYPLDVTFENAGTNINSEYPDYYPFISADETFLIFTTRRKEPPAVLEFDGFYSSDIYISNSLNSVFEKAQGIGTSINSSFDEQAVGLSTDGDELFVYIDNIKDVGDIHLSEKKNDSFRKPDKIGPAVNSPDLETSASISVDGNILFFSSVRPGGYGGRDVYMTRKLPTGSWAMPQNLGPEINTPFNEDFPNLLPDGKTLYFASQGHTGMGGYDIFFSDWDGETNTWTKPKNIGYPINTPADEMVITFIEDASSAYISALKKEGLGDLDIYKVTFNNKDAKQTVIRGNIASVDSLKPRIVPFITVIDKKHPEIAPYTYLPNPHTNNYVIILPPGKYSLAIEAEGFENYSENFTIFDKDQFEGEIERNFKLKPK